MSPNRFLKTFAWMAFLSFPAINVFAEEAPEVKLQHTIESVIDVLYRADPNTTANSALGGFGKKFLV